MEIPLTCQVCGSLDWKFEVVAGCMQRLCKACSDDAVGWEDFETAPVKDRHVVRCKGTVVGSFESAEQADHVAGALKFIGQRLQRTSGKLAGAPRKD